MTETTAKRPPTRGSWKPGKSANPAGRPAAGLQSFKDRLAYWLDTKTIGEIAALVENPKKWSKLLAVDALVARRIHEAAQKTGTSDFVALLDRLLGKPAITGDLVVTHELGSKLDKAEKLLSTDADFTEVPSPAQALQLPPPIPNNSAADLAEKPKL